VKGFAIACDVTDANQVRAAFDRIAATYGGLDIVVSNAGAAWQGRIGDVDDGAPCANRSSSISGRIRAWRRTRCASCGRRGWAAVSCSTPRSRR
jgi:NAD(P)-dependent dehydrogenase (short-subunit alcohol dehydrogenase family)